MAPLVEGDVNSLMDVILEAKFDWERCWQAVCALRPNHRAVFLLGRKPVQLVLLTTCTDPCSKLAELLGYDREEMEAIWKKLPLEDGEIARRLNTTRDNVQTMRNRCLERIRKNAGFPDSL